MKISAVIPAYNSEVTIGRAIDSVLKQTRPADEIIVIDDGSSDNTAEIIRSYGDKIRLIQQENAGVSVARNAGINIATGDWIAFLDADDEWLPEKLKLQIEHLQRNPDLKWTYSNYYRKSPLSQELEMGHTPSRLFNVLNGKEFVGDYFQADPLGGHVWTCTLIVHDSVFEKTGMFEPGMKRAQDVDLWHRIAYQYPTAGYLQEPLAVYHMDTPDSSTKLNDDVGFMIHLVHRHEELSKKHHRYEAFRPCIRHMVQVWIRQLIRKKRYADIRVLLDCFKCYLPGRFKREMAFRLFCPPICSPIAQMVQRLKVILK